MSSPPEENGWSRHVQSYRVCGQVSARATCIERTGRARDMPVARPGDEDTGVVRIRSWGEDVYVRKPGEFRDRQIDHGLLSMCQCRESPPRYRIDTLQRRGLREVRKTAGE